MFIFQNSRAPKKGICYLRQTSKDDIAPRPTKPLPCYIRHESFRSQQSYDGMEVGSSAVDNTDILSNLAACSEVKMHNLLQRNDNYMYDNCLNARHCQCTRLSLLLLLCFCRKMMVMVICPSQ